MLWLRVAARYQKAEQLAGQRQKAKDLTTPVNKPRGIDREVSQEHGAAMPSGNEDYVKPDRRDIRPEDVFSKTPNQMAVRNFAETGEDLQRAIDKQIPKDKGYDTVKNLSQYLLRTDGGGGTDPVK